MCCRPTNETNVEYQNNNIDPLAKIDKTKIRHWVYIVNNVAGATSNQGTAMMSQGEAQFIKPPPMQMMMGPPPM